ncbi:alpha-N-acetylgalactosaminide alpha-2,6-sialyltransferase 2-like [Diadema antillarum]|uniref:alpha-N-acetylgalactosaminide alpha-2,6-sialyltransferase 2-like n=1 Tax=Diadema antillarum TaxID=105358 RepID=UPI003A878791
MWLKLFRSRAVHLMVISGVIVYVLLTLVGMLMHESEHASDSAHQRYINLLNSVQREDRGLVIGEEAAPQDPNQGHIAADDANFIYVGKQAPEPQEHLDSDKLADISKLLQNIEHKLDKGDADQGQLLSNDLKDVQKALKGLLKEPDESPKEKYNRIELEEPNKRETPASVDIDTLPFLTDPSQTVSHCPKTVQTLAKYSKWFRDRYEHGIKLFADFEDVRSYKNYHKLDHYTLPFGFRRVKRSQLGELLQHPNFTNAQIFGDKERPRCLRCAVVGCGGILNGSFAGAEIDSHDLVFRLNRALSSGRFAQDVGVKTSFYTFFPESMHAQDVIDENAQYVFTMFKQYDVDYMENIMKNITPPIYVQKGKKYKLKRPPIPASRLKLLHPDFSRYVFTRFLDGKAHRPTTGALVVMLAVHICDEVTIYGFGYDQRFTLHYYDKAFVSHTDKSTALHDVDNERGLWNKLHEEGVIRFFKRDL